MADNIEQLIDIDTTEKKISPEELGNYEVLQQNTFDLSNLLSVLRTAGNNATKLIFERVLGKSKDQ